MLSGLWIRNSPNVENGARKPDVFNSLINPAVDVYYAETDAANVTNSYINTSKPSFPSHEPYTFSVIHTL